MARTDTSKRKALLGFNISRHATFALSVELTFFVFRGNGIITPFMAQEIQVSMAEACARIDAELIGMEVPDSAKSVTVLVSYQPKTSIAILVNTLKSVSGKRVKSLPLSEDDGLKAFVSTGLWERDYYALAKEAKLGYEEYNEYQEAKQKPFQRC